MVRAGVSVAWNVLSLSGHEFEPHSGWTGVCSISVLSRTCNKIQQISDLLAQTDSQKPMIFLAIHFLVQFLCLCFSSASNILWTVQQSVSCSMRVNIPRYCSLAVESRGHSESRNKKLYMYAQLLFFSLSVTATKQHVIRSITNVFEWSETTSYVQFPPNCTFSHCSF